MNVSSDYAERIGIAAALTGLVFVALAFGAAAAVARGGAVTVQGEAPTSANIASASDPRASGGRYLRLATDQAPRGPGWYATYRVTVPAAGIYHLDAVVTSPAMADRSPKGGSWFGVSVNGSSYQEVAKSEPDWADSRQTPRAWGSLVHARLGDVELRRGANTISFRVNEMRLSTSPIQYRFLLDSFTVTPASLGLARAYVGDPGVNLGTYRSASAILHFALNGHARHPETLAYQVFDYFSRRVAVGVARIRSGSNGTAIRLPRLPPGSYRATAALRSAPRANVTGFFARLPARRPVTRPANRFAATISAPWLLPPSRIAPFAGAMRDAGIGYVRDEADWNVVEPVRGEFLTTGLGRITRDFRQANVSTLDAIWTLTGDLRAPAWSRTPSSGALPDDLRDAYALTSDLAAQPSATRPNALEVWNEPDVDVQALKPSRTPPDRHAAYIKAATLGITDRTDRPLASLSGLAGTGTFQDLMLQNDVTRYADLWAFHAYGYALSETGSPVLYPRDAEDNAKLRRLYEYRGQVWMTESGIFLKAMRGGGLSLAQQVAQARYLVQSTVSDLAVGVDKVFWFDGPPYCAADFACFGLFDGNFQPWPAYSAQAAMTSILGTADFARRVGGLPKGAKGYAFKDGRRAVTVVWAATPAQARVPVPGGHVHLYDVMGALRDSPALTGGTVRITASPDPIYLVSDGGDRLGARQTANDERRTVPRLSPAEHIVLDQRFAAAAMPKPRPFGYRLGATTAMSLDVYNFNDAPETVTVVPHAWGGWAVTSAQVTVTVPARGRVALPFTLTAAAAVHARVDYPLVFEATMGGQPVPPSVSRILLVGERRGAAMPLTPSITRVSPADGATRTSGLVVLRARIADALSGVDPARVVVEVDGRRARRRFDRATGRLSAPLRLVRGTHTLWIRAFNNAGAPAQASVRVSVQ
jgi:hypothetical protein